MNKVILCEGATDAILLSYYLEKTAGWTYCRSPGNLAIKATKDSETVNWYHRGNDYLLICGVGGKDNFGNFFDAKIKNPLLTANAFGRMAVVTDRDPDENGSGQVHIVGPTSDEIASGCDMGYPVS